MLRFIRLNRPNDTVENVLKITRWKVKRLEGFISFEAQLLGLLWGTISTP